MPPVVVPSPPEGSLVPETVEYSRVCLAFLVGPEDVGYSGHCRGGVLLKLMDECAGICSVKHCRANMVTACLHATNFHQMIKKGEEGWGLGLRARKVVSQKGRRKGRQ